MMMLTVPRPDAKSSLECVRRDKDTYISHTRNAHKRVPPPPFEPEKWRGLQPVAMKAALSGRQLFILQSSSFLV